LIKKCYKVGMQMSKRVQGYVAMGAIMAITALLAAAGCGGGDDPPAGSASAAAPEKGAGNGGAGGQGGQEASGGEEPGESVATGTSGGEGAGSGSSGGSSGGEGAAGGGKSTGGGEAGLQGRSAKGGTKGKRKPRGGESSGGSEGSADGSTFFASADSICQERRKNTRQNLTDYTGVGIESLGKNAGKIVNELVIPNLEGEMDEIRALNPPASAEGAVNDLFGWIEKMIAAGKDDPEAFLLSSKLVPESEEAAKQNGFGVCGGI
jgi:hypothetical protein